MGTDLLPVLDLAVGSRLDPPAVPAPSVRVALVNMPFAVASYPSIQCGLLKATLARAGHAVDVLYLNLELAAELGADTYRTIASLRTDHFLGEWLFTVAAFGERSDEDACRAAVPKIDRTCEELGMSFEDLCRLRNEAMPALVERWYEATDWSAYAAVGFTSTFEQNVPALALAHRIKERHPGIVTIFGGANFDGEMGPEYMRAFPWIDYAVSGEGDEVLPALVARIARGESGIGIPGVTGRLDGAVVEGGQAPLVRDMDRIPDPDYDEYFATRFRLGRDRVLGNDPPVLLVESARGCWWGQKHHCTFCGLNNSGMTFRSKSATGSLAGLRHLADRYQIINFQAVDNIIDMRYLDDLCGPLAEERYDYSIFYEVKANLTRTQLCRMARAGIKEIQPGIESLNTHILTLMRKGTTGIRNVRLLKWAHYYGMGIGWNLLCGFPGEQPEDYEQQKRWIPLLFHLPPPSGPGPLWMERFSPYFNDPSFPVRSMTPRAAYSFIYPADRIDLRKIAYFFDYEMDDVIPFTEHRVLMDLVARWRELWKGRGTPPLLVYQRAPDWLQVVDRREPSQPRAFALHGPEADAYEFCGDTDRRATKVAEYLNSEHGAGLDAATVEGMLRRFCEMGLMLEEDGHFLSLALPANPHW
ncbi:MAG: RiPP maturation radical SAM C-methyltransferase [Dehalococcoidia bacterium]